MRLPLPRVQHIRYWTASTAHMSVSTTATISSSADFPISCKPHSAALMPMASPGHQWPWKLIVCGSMFAIRYSIYSPSGPASRIYSIKPRQPPKLSASSRSDKLVESRKEPFFVIPADPGSKPALDVIQGPGGIQYFQRVTANLDPVFQRGDDFLRDHQ
jgi:hypothetical protein